MRNRRTSNMKCNRKPFYLLGGGKITEYFQSAGDPSVWHNTRDSDAQTFKRRLSVKPRPFFRCGSRRESDGDGHRRPAASCSRLLLRNPPRSRTHSKPEKDPALNRRGRRGAPVFLITCICADLIHSCMTWQGHSPTHTHHLRTHMQLLSRIGRRPLEGSAENVLLPFCLGCLCTRGHRK